MKSDEELVVIALLVKGERREIKGNMTWIAFVDLNNRNVLNCTTCRTHAQLRNTE